jgi:Ca2+/Na+ antiporter
MTTVLLLLAGLAMLLVGGASLVRGASGIAEAHDISPLVIGLTVVAFGTSAPELVVNVLGAIDGETDIANFSRQLDTKTTRAWMFILAGFFSLGLGGELTITHGVKLAEILNVSTTIIGMAVIAIGTSLPEFVTSIIAAMRKEADLCVGNVIGSNIFNILLVLPISALVYPLSIPEHGTTDIIATLLFAAVLIPVFIMRGQIMSRTVGGVFLGAYLLYMYLRITG